MIRMSILAVVMLLCVRLSAQQRVSGVVMDVADQSVLAFAHIIANGDPSTGVVSDIDGRFVIADLDSIAFIDVSHLGYQTKRITATEMGQGILRVWMQPDAQMTGSVVVTMGENPADVLMRRVIANRKLNNPENLDAFYYRSYNKVVFDAPGLNEKAKQESNAWRNIHLFMMESVSERRFEGPQRDHEVVIANRVSGLQSPQFAALGTSFQPFAFYEPMINILDQHYLNPISPRATDRYDFELTDTLLVDGDTVYQVSFKPTPGKKFDGLEGILQISTHRYGVRSVKAWPAEHLSQSQRIVLRQRYQQVGEQWFPDQLDFSLASYDMNEKLIMTMESKSYIRDVQINPDLGGHRYTSVLLEISDSASRQDSAFWAKYQPKPYTARERTTYQVIDSLGQRYKFDQRLHTFRRLADGQVPLKWVEVRLRDLITINGHEGLRLGLGLQTSERISKRWVLGGFAGYGFKDKTWKYGGDLSLKLWEKPSLKLDLRYANTLLEVGRPKGEFVEQRRANLRDLMGFRMDRIEQQSAGLGWRALKYGQFHASINRMDVDPTYNYQFHASESQDRFRYTAFMFRTRYAYGQKVFKALDQRVNMPTAYPILDLVFTRAMSGLLDGEMDFQKVEARLSQSFFTRMVGLTKLSLSAGWVDRSLPYGLLFSGDGVDHDDNIVYVSDYFQTMHPYEFLSDRYATFRLIHSFDKLLVSIGRFQPQLSIVHAMSWGDLRHPEHHSQVAFQIRDQVFWESGLVIDNIFRLKQIVGIKTGYGLGVFARYGAYAHGDLVENFVIRLSTTIEN